MPPFLAGPVHAHCTKTEAHGPHEWEWVWAGPNDVWYRCCGAYPVSRDCPLNGGR